MKEDLNIFLKYIFNVKEFIKIVKEGFKQLFEAKSLSQLFLILSILIAVLIGFNRIKGTNLIWFVVIFSFILFLYFKYVTVYKGGEHRKWYRDLKGIPAKKDLVREEFDLRENKEGEQSG
jgi:hypothetical protein